MRLLVLFQAHDSAKDHPGYYDGFQRLMREGVLSAFEAIPYIGVAETQGWDALWDHACARARAMEADAVFLHFFQSKMPDPIQGIRRLQGLPSRPTVFSSLGDGYGRWGKRVPQGYRQTTRLAEVNFLTGMGYVAQLLRSAGGRNLVYMPNGVCQVRFAEPLNRAQYRPTHDVAFIGNYVRPRNFLSELFWNGRKRNRLLEAFARHYGDRFAVYGRGWEHCPCNKGPLPYDDQQRAYRDSRVALGGLPYVYYDYYTSDRVFVAMGSGIPFVDYAEPMVDRLFVDGRDWWLGRTTSEMIGLCDHLLARSDAHRLEIGDRVRKIIMDHHTQYHRCREMIKIVADIRTARQAGHSAVPPKLSFLDASLCVSDGPSPAIVNWVS